MLRRGFKRRPEHRGDDVLPLIQMIEQGYKLAYVPAAGIVHLHLRSFSHFMKKYQQRIRNSLLVPHTGIQSRAKYLSFSRKARKYLWLAYGGTVLGPVLHGVWWAVRDRELCWLWHIPASVGLAYLIVFEVIWTFLFKRRAMMSAGATQT